MWEERVELVGDQSAGGQKRAEDGVEGSRHSAAEDLIWVSSASRNTSAESSSTSRFAGDSEGVTMSAKTQITTGVAIVIAAVAVATAGGQSGAGTGAEAAAATCRIPQGSERLRLDPANFTTRIDNPYWPLRPGSRWVYRETDPAGTKQKVVVTVTSKTKKIANGITARVVHDVVTEGGKPVEVTDDWYAQDRCGNIWYLGEATKEFENGKVVSTEGSFEAGVDGAQPGIVMPAKPRAGMRYRQEYYVGHAEDRAEVLSLKEQVEVPVGFFGKGKVLMTRDLNPLKPRILEYKFYARGIGPVLAVGVSGGSDREELVSYSKGK